MKSFPAVIGCIVGIVVTMVACNAINSAREAQHRVQQLSDVAHPIRECLDDVVHTQERGDAELARRKVLLLQQRWSAYLDGNGQPPELFASEVMELARPATRPAL